MREIKNWPPKRKGKAAKKTKDKVHRWVWRIHGVLMDNGQPCNFFLEDAHAIMTHLEKTGLASVEDLIALADSAGNIHVSKLPVQQIKQLRPEHGPDIWLNPTGKWVGMDVDETTVAPEPPDLTGLSDAQVATIEAEQAAIKEALQRRQVRKLLDEGADPTSDPKPNLAPPTDDTEEP